MNKTDLQQRTKQFALDIIKFSNEIQNNTEGWVIKKQLLRAGTSVGANYRAVCRARSKNEFIVKLGIVIEEADECGFWLELIIDANLADKRIAEELRKEANEITAIMVSSSNSAVKNLKSKIYNYSTITNHQSKIS